MPKRLPLDLIHRGRPVSVSRENWQVQRS